MLMMEMLQLQMMAVAVQQITLKQMDPTGEAKLYHYGSEKVKTTSWYTNYRNS